MKKPFFHKTSFIALLLVVVFMSLAGCETCRGAGRDIKNTDKWMKEHLW